MVLAGQDARCRLPDSCTVVVPGTRSPATSASLVPRDPCVLFSDGNPTKKSTFKTSEAVNILFQVPAFSVAGVFPLPQKQSETGSSARRTVSCMHLPLCTEQRVTVSSCHDRCCFWKGHSAALVWPFPRHIEPRPAPDFVPVTSDGVDGDSEGPAPGSFSLLSERAERQHEGVRADLGLRV